MTRMVEIDDLLPEVLAHAPSCPEPVALRVLREAAREYCEATRLWTETDAMPVVGPDYEVLCSFPDARIVAILDARLDGRRLEPKATGWLDLHVPGWADHTDEIAEAQWITQHQPNTICVVPRQPGTLALRLALKPSREATTLPDFLVEDHGTEIGRGAAGRVLVMPQAEYANPALGAALLSEFRSTIETQRFIQAKGQHDAPPRTKGSFF